MNRKTLFSLGLLVVFVLAACAPNVSAPSRTPTLESQSVAPESALSDTSEAVPAAPKVIETQPPIEDAVAAPTSRGNDLEATDPATVNIASGQPQLIEFFAFW